MDTPLDTSFLANMGIASLVVSLVFIVVFIVAWYKIFTKAGYPGWYTILMFIPAINLIIFLVFAFGQWPILKGQTPSMPQAPAEGE